MTTETKREARRCEGCDLNVPVGADGRHHEHVPSVDARFPGIDWSYPCRRRRASDQSGASVPTTKASLRRVLEYVVAGLCVERDRIVARLRARATSEDVCADRWAQGGDDRMEALHRKAADVLREEATALEASSFT